MSDQIESEIEQITDDFVDVVDRLGDLTYQQGFEVGAEVKRGNDVFQLTGIEIGTHTKFGRPSVWVRLYGNKLLRSGEYGKHVHCVGSPWFMDKHHGAILAR